MSQVKTIGITNQRETCVAWDPITGEHLYNAIVWHDTRTLLIVDELIKKHSNNKDVFRKICGLPINTYFSAVKIKWMIENVDEIKNKLNTTGVYFGTVDSWIVFKLTGNYYTDVTNASRTMLMNLSTLDWDDEMLEIFQIPKKSLPKILNSTDYYGKVNEGFLKHIPITGVIGDQQSACMGHLLNIGEVKNTYGTGSFLLMNTGEKIIQSEFGLLTTVLYSSNLEGGDKKALYALEGAIETAGSAIIWLKNNLKLFSEIDQLPLLFKSVEDSGGVVFVPAFSGLFSPYWDSTARGLLIGLTNHTQAGHILRAAYEAISFRTYEVIKSFEKESSINVKLLKVDGGLTNSDEFLQTQSNILAIDVERKKQKEMTIIGSAIVAGIEKSVGIWNDLEELRLIMEIDATFQTEWSKAYFNGLQKSWNKAVTRCIGWLDYTD